MQAEAKQTDQEVKHAEHSEFVSFTVAGQAFCLKITQIREIRRWSPVTILPHAPADVLGVMNLRGAVIPIYDLSRPFRPAADRSKRAQCGHRRLRARKTGGPSG